MNDLQQLEERSFSLMLMDCCFFSPLQHGFLDYSLSTNDSMKLQVFYVLKSQFTALSAQMKICLHT